MEQDSIANRIEALRKMLGLTQERLAQTLGVTFSTVSRWENGHVTPSRLAWTQLRGVALQHGLDPEILGWPEQRSKRSAAPRPVEAPRAGGANVRPLVAPGPAGAPPWPPLICGEQRAQRRNTAVTCLSKRPIKLAKHGKK